MTRTTILVCALFLTVNLFAQADKSSELFKTLKSKDSLMFNIGFNTCDLKQFDSLLSTNFEFYHDQAGITNNKTSFIESIKNNICKIAYKPRRELIDSSLQVFPLEKNGKLYGAIQVGKHKFYAIEKDTAEYLTSIAQFSSVWLIEKGQWKLSRCLSYDHKEFDKPINDKALFIDKSETERWLKQKHIPALGIAHIKNGKIERMNVFGELEKGKPAPINTIWNVASMAKPITALVTLKLVNDGRWNLDEPIYTYYTDPDVENDPRAKKLTTRHILSHQTGFPNWRRENASKKLTFQFTPGTGYHYSGEGYEYLRKALEAKFHTTLDQLANQLLFKPLKMKDTRFYWDNSVNETRFAKWHKENGEQYQTFKNKSANAADDLLTTVEDYSKFMVYVMNGGGLKDKVYKDMVADQVRVNAFKHFGLGWWVDENINSSKDFAVVHGGDDIGVHTIAFLLPRTKDGLLIFTNSDNGTNAFADVLLKVLGTDGKGVLDVEMK
jgi:CubicO group peptidase (beta-lactamase class C family)